MSKKINFDTDRVLSLARLCRELYTDYGPLIAGVSEDGIQLSDRASVRMFGETEVIDRDCDVYDREERVYADGIRVFTVFNSKQPVPTGRRIKD